MLSHLPVEILRSISAYLPPRSALAFILVCRRIYRACNDWTVWRHIVQHATGYPYGVPTAYTSNSNTWKRYIVADGRASQGRWSSNDIEGWLPHIVALNHSVTFSMDHVSLHRLCDPIFNAPLLSDTRNDRDPVQFITNPRSSFNAGAWHLAQAATFCLSARLLSNETPTRARDREPPQLLQSVQWFRLITHNRLDLLVGDSAKLLTMLHALANRAVGFFYAELHWALATNSTPMETTAGLPHPLTASTIPFASFMEPPVPFTPRSLEAFSKCHLPSMTDPSFFVDDEWTGYTSLNLGSGPRLRFDGIGGDNLDVIRNRLDQLPNGYFPFRVERVIRFRLVQTYGDNRYQLESNCFHNQVALHILTVTVDRCTGRLVIAHRAPFGISRGLTDAVITPFGIVQAEIPQPGHWTWLWKCNWSNPKEPHTGE
ncbi:hypothetical protein K469DRAFT_770532 [Zopfia rhizophila CBS 207.26]|uniref:F-box domain-containing protein n=1 Tax=Zopfia rhizophila CBS 207.26 TaxID=1314779 RepID=A0A6A6EBL4_9PEZI|nr:hypothetical protein K469DRAFT_770532 [Zopfia rhizophila CBS 207.26]